MQELSADKYYTINNYNRSEIKVKGSKFIGTSIQVNSKEEADYELAKIRAEFHDATHNCFAYRFGENGLVFRASDDGEPSGSAGKPILFTIKKHELSDILVVVTRYFGGTKLGVGGLVRAYSDAADLVLSSSTKKAVYLTQTIKIFCTYEDINSVKRLVDEFSVSFEDHYADAIEITAKILNSKVEEFKAKIISQTAGRAGTVDINE